MPTPRGLNGRSDRRSTTETAYINARRRALRVAILAAAGALGMSSVAVADSSLLDGSDLGSPAADPATDVSQGSSSGSGHDRTDSTGSKTTAAGPSRDGSSGSRGKDRGGSGVVTPAQGDDQYLPSEPEAGGGGGAPDPPSTSAGTGSSGSVSSGGTSPSTSSGTSASTGSTGTSGGSGTSQSSTPAAPTAQPTTGQLPVTGFDAGLLASAGAGLALLGFALRRTLAAV